MKDLRPLMKKIEALVEDELELDERPTVGVALALPPDYRRARFVTNTSRQEGIRLFTGAAAQKFLRSMQAQSN